MAKMETDWFDKSYDVIFTNGDKLEFDKKGVWTEVNCKYSAVPVAVVPEAIKSTLLRITPMPRCSRSRGTSMTMK